LELEASEFARDILTDACQVLSLLAQLQVVLASLYSLGVSRVSESLIYSTAWYRMYILTPYTLLCSLLSTPMCRTGVCRMSDRLVYSTVWYRMYILTPYTLLYSLDSTPCVAQACVGRQTGSCIPQHGIVCIFAHPTHMFACSSQRTASHRRV